MINACREFCSSSAGECAIVLGTNSIPGNEFDICSLLWRGKGLCSHFEFVFCFRFCVDFVYK